MRYSREVRIVQLEVGDHGNNCYMLIHPETQASAIIDAPAEGGRIVDAIAGTTPSFIIITHRHSDHWGALGEVAGSTGATVAAHPEDAGELPVKPRRLVSDGDTLMVGTIPLRVLHTPGHTQGSVCLLVGNHLFSGDTLFPGGPGHSISADALRQTIESITRKLFVLPPEMVVYPGHGVGTTIRESMEGYSVFSSKSHGADLRGDVSWNES